MNDIFRITVEEFCDDTQDEETCYHKVVSYYFDGSVIWETWSAKEIAQWYKHNIVDISEVPSHFHDEYYATS